MLLVQKIGKHKVFQVHIQLHVYDESWEETFLEELTSAGKPEDASEEIEDDELDDGPLLPKLKTYNEAINSLEDVCQFWNIKDMGLKHCQLVPQ